MSGVGNDHILEAECVEREIKKKKSTSKEGGDLTTECSRALR